MHASRRYQGRYTDKAHADRELAMRRDAVDAAVRRARVLACRGAYGAESQVVALCGWCVLLHKAGHVAAARRVRDLVRRLDAAIDAAQEG